VVMPDNVTEERTQLLRMYGAEIVYSEGAKGSNGAVEVALELAEQPGFFMPYQYGNEANPLAHYNGTAVEILEELDTVTAFVGGLGTGGTLMGNGRRFKENDPETLIIDITLLDRKIMVSNRDAIVWTKKLLEEEGVFSGVSGGAIASVAARIAGELDSGNVVFLIPDDGWKYLSSGVYTKPLEEIENLDSTVWW
jgi:cysteine synthase